MHVALDELDLGRQVPRAVALMDLFHELVVDADLVPLVDSSRSTACEPMKPAPPVTRTVVSGMTKYTAVLWSIELDVRSGVSEKVISRNFRRPSPQHAALKI